MSWVKSGDRSQNVFPGKTSTQKIITEANKTTLVEGYWALDYQSPTTLTKWPTEVLERELQREKTNSFVFEPKDNF